jgi:hypothetical protein
MHKVQDLTANRGNSSKIRCQILVFEHFQLYCSWGMKFFIESYFNQNLMLCNKGKQRNQQDDKM